MIRAVRSAVLCDEVRREDNGKALFIGVYGNNVIAWARPAVLELRLVLSFAVDTEDNEAELRLVASTENVQQVTIRGIDGWANLIVPLQLILTEPMPLRVAIRNSGQEWIDLGAWNLAFGEDVEERQDEAADELRAVVAKMKAASDS